jgi:secreted trypsin-like serine protease
LALEGGSWRYHHSYVKPQRVTWACLLGLAVMSLAAPDSSLGIVGGRPVPVQEAPWTVEIFQHGYPTCTGVILDATHVLTAGHCLFSGAGNVRQPPSQFLVVTGVSNFRVFSSPHAQVRRVAAAHLMPGHLQTITGSNAVTVIAHDLAILVVSKPLLIDKYVKPISLTARPLALSRSHFAVAGFGETVDGDTNNGPLEELVAPHFLSFCSTSTVVCIVSSPGSTCFGDSGAGLVVTSAPHPALVGILSTSDCAPGARNDFVALTSNSVEQFLRTSDA